MKDLTEKKAINLTSPNKYVLVTSLDKDNKPNVLGVGWITRTSWKPFLILISIDHSRYSHEGIKLHKEFVINYPSKNQTEFALLAGTKSGRDIDKISTGNIDLIESVVVKVPTIKDVTVAFECKTVSEHITGDHTIFVGEVVASRGNPDNDSILFSNDKRQLFPLNKRGIIKK